jgi:exodeoxyribonuclease VII large subunit
MEKADKIYQVSELNNELKLMIKEMYNYTLTVEGEISGFRGVHSSGHSYFSLKDENSRISCSLFKFHVDGVDILPENGKNVKITAKLDVYNGELKLIVLNIQDAGIGVLFAKYQKLLNKLQKEGLFDNEHKKEIPEMPINIGVVTSGTGEAIHDILKTLRNRFQGLKILLYDSLVQGDSAPLNLIKGIESLDQKNLDVIIIGRGGGSFEDLFCFNDEDLARSIFKAQTPIISAVGHEKDTPISDMVSDMRVSTPTQAAEIITPYTTEYLIENLNDTKINIIELLKNCLFEKIQNLDSAEDGIKTIIKNILNTKKEQLKLFSAKNKLLSVHTILDRGYSLTLNNEGKKINNYKKINKGDDIKTIFAEGSTTSTIKEIFNK